MYYFKRVKNGKIVSVEAKSRESVSPNFIGATEAEYVSYLASIPPSPLPESPRDLAAEIDELKAKVEKLEKEK